MIQLSEPQMTSDHIGQMFRKAVDLDESGRARLLDALPVSDREQLQRLLEADSHGEDSGLFESLQEQDEPTPEPSSLTNTRIRDYELRQIIGEGGMGTVYRAHHLRLKCDVALKVLPLNRVSRADTIARFEREMAAVGQLKHPNIVQAMDAGEEGGLHYLVLEFIDGTNVATVSKTVGQLSVADACEIIRQTALGLDHAHSRKLIHRDIKPSNLLVSKEGAVSIADLGLATLQQENSSDLTAAGQIMGTLDYIAPEQIEDPRHVDPRADLYSLGCTFYQLLTGRAPFSEPELESLLKKLRAHESMTPKPIAEFREGVPVPVINIVQQLIAKSPADRIQSADKLAQSLKPFVKDASLSKLVHGVERYNTTIVPTECMANGSTNEETVLPTVQIREVSQQLKAAPDAKPNWKKLTVIATCIAAICALALFIQQKYTNETPTGTIVIETAGGEIELAMKGSTVSFKDPADGKPVRVAVNEASGLLEFTKEGFEAISRTVNLKSKDGRKVSIRFEPKAGSESAPTLTKLSPRDTVAWALKNGVIHFNGSTGQQSVRGENASQLPDDVSGIWHFDIRNDKPGQVVALLKKLEPITSIKSISVYGKRSLDDETTRAIAKLPHLTALRIYCPWTHNEINSDSTALLRKARTLGLLWRSAQHPVDDETIRLTLDRFPGLTNFEFEASLLTAATVTHLAEFRLKDPANYRLNCVELVSPNRKVQMAMSQIQIARLALTEPVTAANALSLPDGLTGLYIDGATLTSAHFDKLAKCKTLKFVQQRIAAVDRKAVADFKTSRPDITFNAENVPNATDVSIIVRKAFDDGVTALKAYSGGSWQAVRSADDFIDPNVNWSVIEINSDAPRSHEGLKALADKFTFTEVAFFGKEALRDEHFEAFLRTKKLRVFAPMKQAQLRLVPSPDQLIRILLRPPTPASTEFAQAAIERFPALEAVDFGSTTITDELTAALNALTRFHDITAFNPNAETLQNLRQLDSVTMLSLDFQTASIPQRPFQHLPALLDQLYVTSRFARLDAQDFEDLKQAKYLRHLEVAHVNNLDSAALAEFQRDRPECYVEDKQRG